MSTGNNALAGTGGLRQPVHKDTRFRHPKCPFVVVANTAIVDFTEENGATEFWLGSHAFSDERDQTVATPETVFGKQKIGSPSCPVKSEVVEARRKIRPPIQATMKKGDVMLRDFRCWHAGMPNGTDKDRIMVAQIWAVRSISLSKDSGLWLITVAGTMVRKLSHPSYSATVPGRLLRSPWQEDGGRGQLCERRSRRIRPASR